MTGYIKFYDEAALWLRIVLSLLGLPAFLYRLFQVILDKAKDTNRLVYLILNVIPIIGTVIYVVDVVWCALKRPLPLCFADWNNAGIKEEEAVETSAEEKGK